jgi:hypothetical protein
MPGLSIQIDQVVGGLDLAQLASGAGGQYATLGQMVTQWKDGPPGDFGAALSGLAGVAVPNLSLAGALGGDLSALLPNLQGNLGGLVGSLQGDVAALPEHLKGDLLGAIQPFIDRITALQGLLTSDWSCGLVAGAGGGLAPAAPLAEGGGGGGGGGGEPPPDAGQGALSPTQVTAAQTTIDTLPADLSVPALLHWVHDRVGTFRPGYFTVRSIPLLDDLRDPLDTLIRWEAAQEPAVRAELQQTLATLAALIAAHTTARFAAALPDATVAALPAAALGSAAEPFVAALEALATAVQAKDTANLAARLADVQGARAALLTQNAAVAAASAPRATLAENLARLPGEIDAGVCRLLVLLQPRPTLADLATAIGPVEIPALPADLFAPLTSLIDTLRGQLTGLLDTLDISAVTDPLTSALNSANQAVEAVEQGLAQLTAEATQALGQAQSAIAALDIGAVTAEATAALEAATSQISDAVGEALGPATAALGQALTAASDAMDAMDPEALTEPILEAIQALGDLLQQDVVGELVTVLDQLKALAASIEQLDFEPVGDGVIAAIGDIKALLAKVDPASLPAPGADLIASAMSVLPPSLVPLTDPLISELDVQVSGSPTDLLESVKTLPDEVRERLLAFSPRAALQPVLEEPYRQLTDGLDGFSPGQWLDQADGALAELRQRLARQMDVATLLAPVAEAHGALLGELDKFRPSTLLAPLEETLESALSALGEALPVGDFANGLADGLNSVMDRIRSVTRTVDAALDVAEHLSGKLAGLGDATSQFDSWLDSVLAKVPETASGALATAVNDLRETARAVRSAQLSLDWASARQALADALAAAGGTARLTRLTLARGRVQGGLAALPPAAAATRDAIAAWLVEPATQTVADGLTALAALDRALGTADTALQQQFQHLTERYPGPDGPLAPLVPNGPATLREWVREAVMNQFGLPVVRLLESVGVLRGLLTSATTALRALVEAVEGKLEDLLAAPQALADLLGNVADVQERLTGLDLGIYTQQVDAIYQSLLDQVRALDPRKLAQPLEAARDRILGQLSLATILPPGVKDQLDDLADELQAKVGSLDPDALLLAPLDEEYRQTIEPLVAALDISATIEIIIKWINDLPEDLQAQIARVDVAYQDLLASAPGGSGGGASASVSI